MNSAINLYSTDQSGASGYSLGTASTTYISVYDPAATTTAGTNCGGMGLSTIGSGWSYHCPASSTLRSITNTGWIPINFSAISAGSPISVIPQDPTNTTSSLLYYEYLMNGSQYELAVPLESTKYLKQELIIPDLDPTRDAVGSNFSLLPQEEGLVGYWPLNEGQGTIAYDQSGYGNNGSWSGAQAGTSGYYSAGKVGAWAGAFNLGNAYIAGPAVSGLDGFSSFTLSAWINQSSSNESFFVSKKNNGYLAPYELFVNANGSIQLIANTLPNSNGHYAAATTNSSGLITYGVWHHVVATFNGSSNMNIYVDGTLASSTISLTGSPFTSVFSGTAPILIGAYSTYGLDGTTYNFNGLIDDVRIYNRVLSATEIQQIYNTEK
jgi:hypothetical protein